MLEGKMSGKGKGCGSGIGGGQTNLNHDGVDV